MALVLFGFANILFFPRDNSVWQVSDIQVNELTRLQLIYCVLNIALVMVALLFNESLPILLAAVGLFVYIAHLAQVVFKDSMLFPFMLSFVGLTLIYLGGTEIQ